MLYGEKNNRISVPINDNAAKKTFYAVNRTGILLCGISSEGFRVYNAVYVGNHQIIYTPYGDAKVAHPDTFIVLSEGYARDNKHFYLYGSIVEAE